MLNKLRKTNQTGFTLVELIVVLVILAILAALLIPALTGYIDKAKEKQIIGETRQAVMAAQQVFLKPLDPENMKGLERYFLIRIRWLSALCLLHLERQQEAAPIIRFLAQYHIEL